MSNLNRYYYKSRSFLVFWWGVLTQNITKTKDERIPEGPYCYTPLKWVPDEARGEGAMKLLIKSCPYYTRREGFAYCEREKVSGEDDFVFNDQVKCCGINDDCE